MKLRNLAVALSLVLVTVHTAPKALAQSTAAPAPAQTGPSLDVTMKFIGDFLTAESPVNWSNTSLDGDGDPITLQMSAEYRNFSHTGCVLRYEYQLSYYDYPWHGVAEDFAKVNVMSMKVEAKSTKDNRALAALGGKPNITISPAIYEVDGFYLSDQSQAERLLKALTHAASLCGAASDQPF